MQLPTRTIDIATQLDHNQFNKTRDEKLRPSLNLTGLKYLREKAGRERDLRELYRGCAPYELLQNADDVKARNAVFILTRDGLCFAHDGRWFTSANFQSLADGWSDKDPRECIGHKGLGFRSVLDITPAPHVLKIDSRSFFGFKFSWEINSGHIQETLNLHPELREEYDEWTKHGQSACPIMAIPGEVKKQKLDRCGTLYDRLVSGQYGSGLTTMFWLPARDPDTNKRVIEDLEVVPLICDKEGTARLSKFLELEVTVLLPFLSSLENVSLFTENGLLAKATASGNRKTEKGDEVRVELNIEGKHTEAVFFQMHSNGPIPTEIKKAPHTPKAVRQMLNAAFTLSVRLHNGAPVFDRAARFHVYFPTEEPTGFGFTIHGDFYVKPDRTRLMDSSYNDWLMSLAARTFADDFLTQLLERYSAKSVFEALQPAETAGHEAATRFASSISQAVKHRTAPFIPGSSGLMRADAVALPSIIDNQGFWATNFTESLQKTTPKKAFLDPGTDSIGTRKFLKLAGVDPLQPEKILDFIEDCAIQKPSAGWWFEIYKYLANEKEFSRWNHDFLAGRHLLPDEELKVIKVPRDSTPVVCFPPADDKMVASVPSCFRSSFVFLNTDLSKLLHSGPDRVRFWLLENCRISRFEATDLLPRAVRAVVQSFYDGSIAITAKELSQLWIFLRNVIALSRTIASPAFWQEIGRLPIATSTDFGPPDQIPTRFLMPAFLAYWPDGDPYCELCIQGVARYSRLSGEFLPNLLSAGAGSENDWRALLSQAGISGEPKLLRYSQIVGERAIPFTAPVSIDPADTNFTGERQHDLNLAVARNLRDAAHWPAYLVASQFNSGEGRSLQSLTLVDGFDDCVALAVEERRNGEKSWQQRLWSLIKALPVSDTRKLESDLCFRRLSRGGVATEPCGSYAKTQLEQIPWVPSTLGPSTLAQSFLRLSTRRLISRAANDEIGDLLLHYVVAPDLDTFVRLSQLGVEPLEDAGSVTPLAMARFLAAIGARLTDPETREAILSVRSRWRAVRGAIQEIYRTLNQLDQQVDLDDGIRFAARVSGQVDFLPRPLFFAEPGSAIERSFSDAVAFFDADRPYHSLFESLGIIRLASGTTVEEEFCDESRAAPSQQLQDAIVNQISPYLLAVIVARSEDKGHRELVLRRLRERFDVQVSDRLLVTFTLHGDPPIERSIEFPHFYLRRSVVGGSGAIKESHYTLFVAGHQDVTLADLDGDALGDALAPVFFDNPRDDLSSLFPRIVSRFQVDQGNQGKMEQFLFTSLGISKEAQEQARDDIEGPTESAPPIPPPEPPPATITPSIPPEFSKKEDITKKIDEQKDKVHKRLDDFMDVLHKMTVHKSQHRHPLRSGKVTREQEVRGRRGEEEFLRRIKMSGGWMGFGFIGDVRTENAGYDFGCDKEGKEVKVEVKTFSINGHVVVSANELQMAAQSGDSYYLVGFLDDGSPEQRWPSSILQNPMPTLVAKGRLDIDVELQVDVDELFILEIQQKSAEVRQP